MIKEAIQYLVSLKDNKTYQIGGYTYSDRPLERITDPKYYPRRYSVTSLSALVGIIKAEMHNVVYGPLFVRVTGPTSVTVDASLDGELERFTFYAAECEDANFRAGWRSHEEAIIQLQSSFLPTNDRIYLLDLLSRVSIEDGVTTHDNGVNQTVVAKQGVSLKTAEAVKNIVSLKPFRTFREVAQPESEFLLRVNERGDIGLFEADGGIWKMEAKKNIANYLSEGLKDLIETERVCVLEG